MVTVHKTFIARPKIRRNNKMPDDHQHEKYEDHNKKRPPHMIIHFAPFKMS
jgi:hypothetical protein